MGSSDLPMPMARPSSHTVPVGQVIALPAARWTSHVPTTSVGFEVGWTVYQGQILSPYVSSFLTTRVKFVTHFLLQTKNKQLSFDSRQSDSFASRHTDTVFFDDVNGSIYVDVGFRTAATYQIWPSVYRKCPWESKTSPTEAFVCRDNH